MSLFSGAKIEVDCPGCQAKVPVSLDSLLSREETSVACPSCGATINIQSDASREEARKALDGLERTVKGLSKTVNIKLKL